MFNPEIKYAFNQFETALIAFCANIQLKLQNMVPNLPVFIMNGGDFSYYVDKKFVETTNEELYLKTPRFVIKIEDIQMNQQEDSNQYNKIYYTFDNNDGKGPINYQCVARRKAYNLQLSTNFVSPNLITALNHTEVMAVLSARDNVFTYEFLGNTIQSAYTIQPAGNDLPSIDMGQGGTRNVNSMNQIELQIHLIVPRIESIIPVDETGFEEIDFGLVSGDEKHNETHKFDEIRKDKNEPAPKLEYKGRIVPKNINFK
mgnify:CR=1 FL=1|jgi:hypothetical protein